jgi:hypothetical protein
MEDFEVYMDRNLGIYLNVIQGHCVIVCGEWSFMIPVELDKL